jgi:hypothetical protein
MAEEATSVFQVLGERRHGVEALAGAVLLVEEYLDLSTEVRNT